MRRCVLGAGARAITAAASSRGSSLCGLGRAAAGGRLHWRLHRHDDLEPLPDAPALEQPQPAQPQGEGTAPRPWTLTRCMACLEESGDEVAGMGATGFAEEPVQPVAEFREQREDETMSEYEGEMPDELVGSACGPCTTEPGEISPGNAWSRWRTTKRAA